jgi:hypothetical protein
MLSITGKMQDKEKFIPCSCGSEALHLYKHSNEEELYISIYERGYAQDNRYTWRQRIKHCWYILLKGAPYGDQIVLDRKGRSELLASLIDIQFVKKIESLSAKNEFNT